MENQQAYHTPAASPAPDPWPTSPMVSGSESDYNSSSDPTPSTPGYLSDSSLRALYETEPVVDQELDDYHPFSTNEYDDFGAPTPQCNDHLCEHHNDDHGYFFRDVTPGIHGPVPSEPSTSLQNDGKTAALQPSGGGIASTSSQGDNVQAHFGNGLEFANPPLDSYSGPVAFPQAEEVQVHCFQADVTIDDAGVFEEFEVQDQGGWGYAGPPDLLQPAEPDLQELEETEPAVISALRSFKDQMIHASFFPGEICLPRLMDYSALECLKEMVSLLATGPQSTPSLNFLFYFSLRQGWLEQRIWRNNALGTGELRGLILSERGRKQLLRIWQWVSANTDWLEASGLDVPSEEELDARCGRLENLPNECSLANVRLRRDTDVVQVSYGDLGDL